MKQLKQSLVFLLSLVLILVSLSFTALAEGEVSHFSASTESASVKVGDEFTVNVNLSSFTAASVMGGITYDADKVEFVSAQDCPLVTTDGAVLKGEVAESATQHTVGFSLPGTSDYTYVATAPLFTVTFRAKASGAAIFTLYESSYAVTGDQEYDFDNVEGVTVSIEAGQQEDPYAFVVVTGDGTQVTIKESQMKAAESVEATADAPWTDKKNNTYTGTFYKLSAILENAGLDISDAHGISTVASDGFTNGFSQEDIENLYVYDMGEVIKNGNKPAGAKGTFGTALNGGAGNKWAKDIVKVDVVNDHVMFFKDGECKHYCAICGEDEASFQVFVDGAEEPAVIHECQVKAAESVEATADAPWTDKKNNTYTGTFYKLSAILENAGLDISGAHGISTVASDGFTNGFSQEDIENLYVYDMGEVIKNGNKPAGAKGTFGTALNGGAGNKWAKDIVKVDVVNDHVMFFKDGECKHYCAICGEDEASFQVFVDGSEEPVTIHECQMKAAESAEATADAPWTDKKNNTYTGTFYKLGSILENAGLDISGAHGISTVASDGFTNGFSQEDIENLYVYDMGEVIKGDKPAGKKGTFGTALNGGAGNKWAKDIVKVDVVNDHVMFFKDGECKHYCAICGEDEASITVLNNAQEEVVVYECQFTKDAWYQCEDNWFFVDKNGTLHKGWLLRGTTWYFMDKDSGVMLTGLINDGSANYYMTESGAMATRGWIQDADGSWYYASENGKLKTGWMSSGGKWYYMNPETSAMQTGWVKDNGVWYYMNSSGAMVTGWVKVGSTWYYMNSSGAMQTGWVKVGETWYYLKSSGAMAANEWVTGYYWISASGAWTYQPVGSWKQNSTGWWFEDTSGWYAKNETIIINDKPYTFNAAGYWVE